MFFAAAHTGPGRTEGNVLFSQAVCNGCGAVFASGVLVAERRGDPVTYRGSAGPCPRCGGRGHIPGWTFGFHAAVTAARDQASPAENAAVVRAVGRYGASPLDAPARRALIADLTGDWRGVAVQLGRIPLDETAAALAMLGRMLEGRAEWDRVAARTVGRDGGTAHGGTAHGGAAHGGAAHGGATTSAAPGTPGAEQTPVSA